MMIPDAVVVYKCIWETISNPFPSNLNVVADIQLTEENVKLIQEGVSLTLISSDIIIGSKTFNSSELRSQEQIAKIEILSLVSFDLSEYCFTSSSEIFYYSFSKYFVIPKYIYLVDIYNAAKFDENIYISGLKFAIKVNHILSIVADYFKEMDQYNEYFLLGNRPLVIKSICIFDLTSYCKEADEVLKFINDEFKGVIYKSFLKNQIIESLSSVDEKNRFMSLIRNFQTVFLNFKNSIDLYFNDYDFQKNKNELQVRKIELGKKIHGIVNEISGKVITIPVAYLFILKDFNLEKGHSLENYSLLFISIVYSFIIETTITNQFIFLTSLKNEVSDFVRHPFQNSELESIYETYNNDLTKSYIIQEKLLWFLRSILWFLPILMVIIILVPLEFLIGTFQLLINLLFPS